MFVDLFEMIPVDMDIAERMNEVSRCQTAHCGNHLRQQRVGSDIERDAEKEIRTPLIKLTAQPSILDVALEHRMARRKRHLADFARVPRGHDQAPAVRIFQDLTDELLQLIDRAAVGSPPVTPLSPIDPAQVPICVGPFVPDGYTMFVEVTDIRLPAQEPEQFVRDGFEMNTLGRQKREPALEIKSGLCPEIGNRSYTRSVFFRFAFFKNKAEQVVVCFHADK